MAISSPGHIDFQLLCTCRVKEKHVQQATCACSWHIRCNLMTMCVAHGFMKPDNRGKQMIYFISWSTGHYFHPINADVPTKEWSTLFTGIDTGSVRSPKDPLLPTYSQQSVPLDPVMGSIEAPDLPRTGQCFLSSAPLNFMKFSCLFHIHIHFNSIFSCRWHKVPDGSSTEAFQSFA